MPPRALRVFYKGTVFCQCAPPASDLLYTERPCLVEVIFNFRSRPNRESGIHAGSFPDSDSGPAKSAPGARGFRVGARSPRGPTGSSYSGGSRRGPRAAAGPVPVLGQIRDGNEDGEGDPTGRYAP